jgi:thiamine-phosphate pyrophosphorylase
MKIIQVLDYDTFGDDCIDIAGECAPYADVIWFRIKDESKVRLEAEKLRKALPDAFLALSLDAEAAYDLGYDAVQLGANSDVESTREKYPNLKIGYSAHSVEEIQNKRADYFTLSPVFYTKKDYEVKPLGLVNVSTLGREVYALGGINVENVESLRGLGFAGVAGISFYKELQKLSSISI